MTYKLRRLGNKRKSKQWMEIASRPVSRLNLNLRQFARIPPPSPLNLNILTYLIAPKLLSRLPLKYKQSDLRKLFKFSNSCLVTIFHICLMSKIDIRKFSTTDARRILDIFLAKIVLFPKIRIIINELKCKWKIFRKSVVQYLCNLLRFRDRSSGHK